MSIIPPSGSLVRFDNPTLITSQNDKDRKGAGPSKQSTGLDQQMMDVTAGGTGSPRLAKKQAAMKDLSLEEILDKILPPKYVPLLENYHFIISLIFSIKIELQKIQTMLIYSIVNVSRQRPQHVSTLSIYKNN